LPGILATLNDYKIRATFFVNGEVIRRYPDAVQAIAEAGHEVGSLFYIYFNMTDSRFQLDRDFIKRGLARNEDDYYAATGRELSLLWHAPYYFVNSDIVAASREMNYVYVSRDVDSLDWVTREMSFAARDLYLPAARLVERVIAEKRPGSIVPVLVGTPKGIREDFLFQKLDLLIDGLMERGYRVVPVTTLIEHAR
jgi:peptidoglycan/xylan/chitin deacetylase (PgdA/CDA1 family)